ncbi:MAG: prepilin-type N-terminal cleavage/methylation domain-containing protein [Planctomycetota bacterium]
MIRSQRQHIASRPQRSGMSLIEVVVSTMLVAVVLVGALNTAGNAIQTSVAASTQLEGHTYAAEMLAEIMAMPYCDPEENDPDGTFGIESDEDTSPANRLLFDDLDDYDDWTEPSALAWRDGAARLDTAGWGRSVTVVKLQKRKVTDTHDDGHNDDDTRLITVEVTSPDGQTTTLQGIRSVAGAVEQEPPLSGVYVTGVLLEIATNEVATSDGVSLLNHASAP